MIKEVFAYTDNSKADFLDLMEDINYIGAYGKTLEEAKSHIENICNETGKNPKDFIIFKISMEQVS